MRTKILAGVAAVAFSVAPVAGTLAVDCSGSEGGALTDSISMTINPGCTLSRSSGSATNNITMDWNATNNNAATETLKVVCNDAAGFTVTGTFTNFTGPGAAITYAAAAPTAGKWTAVKGGSSSSTYITSGTTGNVMNESAVTSSSGSTQQITYKIKTGATQARGSYTATATYVAASKT